MGFKRPFDGEELQGLTFKQPRAQCSDKLSNFPENISFAGIGKSNVGLEVSFDRDQENTEEFEQNGCAFKIEDFVKNDDSSSSIPVLSSSLHHKNSDIGPAKETSFSEYFALSQISNPPELYLSYLNHTPRKQVPIGTDYQAVLPCTMDEGGILQLNNCNPYNMADCSNHSERKELVGSCIIPMPNIESLLETEVGAGRKDCSCLDMNSIRCVRQHIMEAREKLRRSIGHEKFVDLGFYEMGEEVACHWSEEEERIFHGVVYSYPASLGFKFWEHLFEVFPSRSTKEIVSFYFNVFMLRRRASQNRSTFLDIDSDDDEWHGINRNTCKPSDNECQVGLSPTYHSDEVGHSSDILTEDEVEVDDDGTSDDSNDNHGDIINSNATEEESSIDSVLAVNDAKIFDDGKADIDFDHLENRKSSTSTEFSVQEDSCMSFEFSTDKAGAGNSFQANGNESKDKCSLPDGRVFLLDSCDSKLWDAECSGSVKGVDLLPTCNIIEEIFGQGTCNSRGL